MVTERGKGRQSLRRLGHSLGLGAAQGRGCSSSDCGVRWQPMDVARIAIVGDFDRRKHSHWATDAALFHAAARLRITVEPHWIGTPELADADNLRLLKDFDGVWGAPGSPYKSMPGILNAMPDVVVTPQISPFALLASQLLVP